jgi:putative flippase GtrA
MKRLTDHTFFRFLLVGASNTLLSAAMMFLLYNLAGLSATWSSAAAFTAGAVLSFFLNRYVTFRSGEGFWKSALKFAVNVAVLWAVCYLWLQKWMSGLLVGGGFPLRRADNISMLVSMGAYTVFNYLGQRFFAFRKW